MTLRSSNQANYMHYSQQIKILGVFGIELLFPGPDALIFRTARVRPGGRRVSEA